MSEWAGFVVMGDGHGLGAMPLVLGVPLPGWRDSAEPTASMPSAEAAGTLFLVLSLRARMIRTVRESLQHSCVFA